MAELNFNAGTFVPNIGSMPKGWYNAIMESSEMKLTKDRSGQFLFCVFSIVDGDFNGRKVETRLNLRNSNQMAVDIAYAQLKSICDAVGVSQVNDSSQMHNIPLKILLGLQEATEQYPNPPNEINGYAAMSSSSDPASPKFATPASVVPPVAPAAASVPPTPPVVTVANDEPMAPTLAPAQPQVEQPVAEQPWTQPPQPETVKEYAQASVPPVKESISGMEAQQPDHNGLNESQEAPTSPPWNQPTPPTA